MSNQYVEITFMSIEFLQNIPVWNASLTTHRSVLIITIKMNGCDALLYLLNNS